MKHTLTNSNIHFDKAIIIDFPGFNFKVATLLRRMSIPILTFITPNFGYGIILDWQKKY